MIEYLKNVRINNYRMINRYLSIDLPICRFCTMYFNIGLFPSKPTVHDTFTALGPTRSANATLGEYGNSSILKCECLFSLPPGDETEQV